MPTVRMTDMEKLAADRAAEIAAEKAAAAASAQVASDEAVVAVEESPSVVLVEVTKKGESLFVNPTTLTAHMAAGWKRA